MGHQHDHEKSYSQPALRAFKWQKKLTFDSRFFYTLKINSNGPTCASTTLAHVLRSSASSTGLRSKRPRNESTLRVEMNGLEEQADNAKARDPFGSTPPFFCSGPSRPSSATDAFDQPLWETSFTSTIGLEFLVLSSLPRHHNRPLAKRGCKKHADGLSRRPHSHVHRPLRCNQGARLDGIRDQAGSRSLVFDLSISRVFKKTQPRPTQPPWS